MDDGTIEALLLSLGVKLDEKSVRRANALFGKTLDVMAGVATAALGAGVALAALAVEAAGAGDEVAKASKRIGVSAQELSELEHAAQLSGAAMTDVEGGFRRMAAAADEAKTKGGEAGEAFKRIGVDPREFESNLELFEALAGGLSGIDDQGKRMALAQDIFGRGGSKLLPLLNEGAEGIRKMREEARTMGAVISNENAAASEAFIDSQFRLERISTRVVRRIGFGLIPAFDRWANRLLRVWEVNGAFIEQRLDRVIEGISKGLDAMAGPLGAIVGSMSALLALRAGGSLVAWAQGANGLAASLVKVAAAGWAAVAPFVGPLLAIAAIALVLDDLRVAAEGGDSALLGLARSMGLGSEFEEAAGTFISFLGDAWDLTEALGSAARDLVVDFGAWAASTLGLSEQFEALVGWIDKMIDGKEILGFLADSFTKAGRGARYLTGRLSGQSAEEATRSALAAEAVPAPAPVGSGGTTINGGAVTANVNASGMTPEQAERMTRRALRDGIVEANGVFAGGAR